MFEHSTRHYERFTAGLSHEVDRSVWVVIVFYWMQNHIHALIKTPQANLCSGMQYWLSGYANWYAKRYHRTGHLFQGHYVGITGFTSGCVCVAPRQLMDMLHAIQRGDFDQAESNRNWFEPLENLWNEINTIRVLHHALNDGRIANTGPLLPLLGELSTQQVAMICGAVVAMLV